MKIAWAFNPFDDNHRLQRTAVAILRGMHRRAADSTEVVYVASPGESQLAVAFDVPVDQRYAGHPMKLIERAVRRSGVANAKVTVLSQRSPSLTTCVRMLAGHLSRRRVDLTLVASHARTGVPRFVLGSFAETLVHLAKTDLLVFNEGSRVARTPKVLLFAHDLSPEGDRGLRQAIRYAVEWKCVLHVVHVPMVTYGVAFPGRAREVELYRRRIQKRVGDIEVEIQRAGLAGSAVIGAQAHSVDEQILRCLSNVRADILLVAGKSGRFAGWLGGSVTRKLMRTAPVPVLVIKQGGAGRKPAGSNRRSASPRRRASRAT